MKKALIFLYLSIFLFAFSNCTCRVISDSTVIENNNEITNPITNNKVIDTTINLPIYDIHLGNMDVLWLYLGFRALMFEHIGIETELNVGRYMPPLIGLGINYHPFVNKDFAIKIGMLCPLGGPNYGYIIYSSIYWPCMELSFIPMIDKGLNFNCNIGVLFYKRYLSGINIYRPIPIARMGLSYSF